MTTVLRAAISVVMLAGFYAVALVLLGVAVLLAVLLGGQFASLTGIKLTIPLFTATIGGVGVAIWKAFRTRPAPPRGLAVGPHQAPALWSTVDELARGVNTRTPQEIRFVPEVNAAVMEQPRMLGLVGGRRYLYIGLPLVQATTVDELRSVLAHELGHYSRQHTRLAALTYRGRLVIAETLDRIGPYNVVGWAFKGYGRLYVLVANAVVRRQEYEADRASVRLAGRETAARALRELPVIHAAWEFFLRTYVRPGLDYGYVPSDLFGGFAELVAARSAELDELRAQDPEGAASRWDTHPPIADRIAAIAALPEAPHAPDGRPAASLFPDSAGVGRGLQEVILNVEDPAVLAWPHFTNAAMIADLQREADRIFRAILRRTDLAECDLDGLLDLVGSGDLGRLAEPFFPYATRREAEPRFAEVLFPLMQLAALQSGVAVWKHSWVGSAQFVSVDGRPLPLEEAAKLAVSPGGVDEARRRLAEMGVHPRAAALVRRTESAVGAEVIAALANVKVGGSEYDLVLLTNGFVLVADPGKVDHGERRLRKLLESAPPVELAARHRWLPYEEIASAAVIREVPARASVTLHDGRELTLQERWGSEMINKESRNVLLRVLGSIGAD